MLAAAHPAAETWVPLQFEAKYKQKPQVITGSILLGFNFLSQQLEGEDTGSMPDKCSVEEAVATESRENTEKNTTCGDIKSQRDTDVGNHSSTDRTVENKDMRANGESGPSLSEVSLEHETEMLKLLLPAGDEEICEVHLPAFHRASSPCSPRGLGIDENEPEPDVP